MSAPLRIGLADDDTAILETLAGMLKALGHQVVFSVQTGRQIVAECQAVAPDLLVTDIQMPELDGLDAVGLVARSLDLPVVVLSGHCDRELIDRAEHNQVLAYLVKPVTQPQLEAAIALAVRRFEECRTLKREAAELRQALTDRKLLERAKGLLMKHLGVGESEAVARLEKLAAAKNKSLVETAQTILNAVELLNTNGKPPDGRSNGRSRDKDRPLSARMANSRRNSTGRRMLPSGPPPASP